MKRNERGFTLMELMVVIVIVAILAAVAVPLYINYVKDAQRTEAKGAIGAIITGEQAYYQRYATYTDDTTLVHVDLSEVSHNWDFTIPAADADGFTVKAQGKTGGSGTENLMVQVEYRRTPPSGEENAKWTEE